MELRVCCIYYFYDIRKIRKLGIGIMTFYKQYRKVPSLLLRKQIVMNLQCKTNA